MYICLKWDEGKLNFLLHQKKYCNNEKEATRIEIVFGSYKD